MGLNHLGKVHPDPSLTVSLPELAEAAAARKYYRLFLNAPNATHDIMTSNFFDTLLKATKEVNKNISSDRIRSLLKSSSDRKDVVENFPKAAYKDLGDVRPTNAMYQWM